MLKFNLFNFLLIFQTVKCFNIDTKSPFIYENVKTQENSTFFGYSIVMYPGSSTAGPGLFIGAPLKQEKDSKYRNGAILHCSIDEICQEIHIGYENSKINVKASKSWIGGSMDIDSDFDRLVTCGFHRIHKFKTSDYYTSGACYWFHSNITQEIVSLTPLEQAPSIHTSSGGTVYYNAHGQAGFSVHMVPNEHMMVLGAPGVLNWQGSTLLYHDSAEIPSALKQPHFRQKRILTENEFADVFIPDATTYKHGQNFGLFGYAVSSGKFYRNKKTYFVSGAPRLSHLSGLIFIYKFKETTIEVYESKIGSSFGEYFGSSLAVGDINKDGFDDLIVGAPFYTNNKFNEGKVYVYLGANTRLQEPLSDHVIVGTATNGQFGTTIQYLKDINKDGYGDVAISAPYELDNSGVVYIYKGSNSGLSRKYAQRIVGKDIYSGIRGFGVSISKPVDIDENGYLDLAIGAPFSEHVVVLRASPIVKIFHKLTPYDQYLYYNTKSFTITLCFWFYSSKNIKKISIEKDLKIDEEFLRINNVIDEKPKTFFLIANRQECHNVTVNLRNGIKDLYNPIKISLSHKFLEEMPPSGIKWIPPKNASNNDHFCVRCPVYDKDGSSPPIDFTIPFSLGCGSDNICNSNLDFKQSLSNIRDGNVFVLGSFDLIKLTTTVHNTGEAAYLTYLLITKPEFITFRQIPRTCEEINSTTIQCNLGIKIDTNGTDTLNLEFDVLNLNNFNDFLQISTTIATSSNNLNSEQSQMLKIKLIRESDMKISGKSGDEFYSFGNITNGKPNFTQTFQIEKQGISPIDLVQVDIEIPHSLIVDNKRIDFIQIRPPSSKFAGQLINCRSNITYLLDEILTENDIVDDQIMQNITTRNKRSIMPNLIQNNTLSIDCESENVICSNITCTVGPFLSQQNIGVIVIKMLANVNLLTEALNAKIDDLIFISSASVTVVNPPNFVQTGTQPDFVTVVTHFIGDVKSEKIAIWIIVVSVVVGVLLLLLIILGLLKAGFFKRSKKEELEKLKEEADVENKLHENSTTEDFCGVEEEEAEILEKES